MKLQAGDKIWITKADDKCEPGSLNYSVNKAFYAEWDGTQFLGCMMTADPEFRAQWALDALRNDQVEMQDDPGRRTNIDCMFEQLEAEGAFA